MRHDEHGPFAKLGRQDVFPEGQIEQFRFLQNDSDVRDKLLMPDFMDRNLADFKRAAVETI
jgi:hypothetical protein